ncbi:MAG: hypothetical protein AB7P40_09280 [Chloroflexota bacterium]
MQRRTRWRQCRSTGWRLFLTRWLLVLIVLVTLAPGASGPASIARANQESVTRSPVGPPPATRQPDNDNLADDATADPGPATATLPAHQMPDELDQLTPTPPAASVAAQAEDAPSAAGRTRFGPGRVARNQELSSCGVDQSHAKAASFRQNDRLVMTYYYYWYDQESLDDPAMAQRPVNDPPLDWRSVEWHERQLLDMAQAGVDVALAVYWGDTAAWSVQGLKPMVEARERLLAAGYRPPAIGLFFDTNMYAQILPDHPDVADLTTADGQEMLAHQVSVFLDQVPPCHRARVDGRVLAFFWRADTEDGDHFIFDDRTFAGLNDLIQLEYGERLHFALEQTWVEAAREAGTETGAADIYTWGAALNGPRYNERTIAIGPGYDDRHIDGRPGYIRDRTDGGTYSRDLRSAVMSGTGWLLLETWNELWEGTAIAETEATGRRYLDITARYTALFHQLSEESARDAWFDLGTSRNAYLRRLADFPVELGTAVEERGRWGARPFREDTDGTGYFHFAIDQRLGLTDPRPLTVEVEYFDDENGSFTLEYDSLDETAPEHGAYKITEDVPFLGTNTWQVHRFYLLDASMRGRQYNGVGDFRIHDRPGPDGNLHVFGRVTVTADPAVRPVPVEPESLTFIAPTTRQNVGLRWTVPDGAASYQVTIQPFAHLINDPIDEPALSTVARTDQRLCTGTADLTPGQESRAVAQDPSCQLRLARDFPDGVYRWRVQALDGNGAIYGDPSDWAFIIVASQ